MTRQSWDTYFLSIAEQVSTRSTCARKAVGCVLTVERRIIATGYNGALPGAPHCTEAGCLLADVTYHAQAASPIRLALCRHDITEAECLECSARVKPVRHCIRTVHAETNALLQAARHGCATQGAHAYVTASPCIACMMHLISAGVAEVIYAEPYRLELTAPIAESSKVVLRQGA